MEEKSLNDGKLNDIQYENGGIAEGNADMAKTMEIQQIRRGEKRAGVFFFLLMLLEIPLSVLIIILQARAPEKYATLISILLTQGYLLLAAVVYILFNRLKWGEDLSVRRYKPSTFFLSLVLLICASPMATWLNLFSQFFVSNSTSRAIFTVTESIPVWMGILVIGCLPGFVEETIYRGIFFSAFRKRSVLTGIIVSSLCFGLMHLNFNQMLYAIYLGVIFSLLVEATGSLVSTMILHMLFNAVNTLYVYLLPVLYRLASITSPEYANMEMEELFNQTQTIADILPAFIAVTPFAFGGLVLVWLLLKAIAGINGRPFTWNDIVGDRQQRKAVKPVTVCLILGWLFCLVTATLNALAE